MTKRFRKKKLFIHPSSQLKYILLSMLPALIMTLFCSYLWIQSGRLIRQIGAERALEQVVRINYATDTFAKENQTNETSARKRMFKKGLYSVGDILETAYIETSNEWHRQTTISLIVLLLVLLSSGLLSLLYSHRIAGAVFNMRRCADMLAKGEDIPPIQLRKHDEFKDLAESLEKLRMELKAEGFLRSKEE